MNGEPLIVLLVEDNLDHAELVMRSLADHRIANKIIHKTDGQSAIDYLMTREGLSLPHVILLDLRLPRVDGLEVLKTIKANELLRTIPVVILTTSEAERDIARAYEYHANSYIVKPVDYEKFFALMDDLGFYWLGWNTHPRID